MYRLAELRRSGTPLLLRPVPAAEDHGWHHGSAHYGDDTLVYHRLVTFWRGPAVRLIRSAITVVGATGPRGTEQEILDGLVIVELGPGADAAGGAYELGMTPDAFTAFQAWLESLRRRGPVVGQADPQLRRPGACDYRRHPFDVASRSGSDAGENEQQVREPVGYFAGSTDVSCGWASIAAHAEPRPAARRSALGAAVRIRVPAGKDERVEGGQALAVGVTPPLECIDVGLFDAQWWVLRVGDDGVDRSTHRRRRVVLHGTEHLGVSGDSAPRVSATPIAAFASSQSA